MVGFPRARRRAGGVNPPRESENSTRALRQRLGGLTPPAQLSLQPGAQQRISERRIGSYRKKSCIKSAPGDTAYWPKSCTPSERSRSSSTKKLPVHSPLG